MRAAAYVAAAGVLAPDALARLVILPVFKARRWRSLDKRERQDSLPLRQRAADTPHTLAFRDYTRVHGDGWVGPLLVTTIVVAKGHTHLFLEGEISIGQLPRPLEIRVFVEGQCLGGRRLGPGKTFALRLPLNALRPGKYEVKVVSNAYGVPDQVLGNGDFRPLSFRLRALNATSGDGGGRNS